MRGTLAPRTGTANPFSYTAEFCFILRDDPDIGSPIRKAARKACKVTPDRCKVTLAPRKVTLFGPRRHKSPWTV